MNLSRVGKLSVYGVLISALVVCLFSHEPACGSDVSVDKIISEGGYTGLASGVAARGSARILVRVHSPFAVECDLSESAVADQRASISRAQDVVLSELAATGLKAIRSYKYTYIPYLALTVDAPTLEALLAIPEVTAIEEDVPFSPTDWNVERVGATELHKMGVAGSGVAIAILDTGVDKNHAYLTGSVVSEACYSTNDANLNSSSVCPGGASQSTAPGSALPYAGNCPEGKCDHGTHVAGIAAGRSGIAGSLGPGVAPQVSVIAVQVFSRVNSDVVSWVSDQIKGLERVYALRSTYAIAAVNMSLGGGSYTYACDNYFAALKAAIDNLRGAGIATVIASGNDGYCGAIAAPACISTAISVGATDKYNYVGSNSNSASFMTLFAPGLGINSAIPGIAYATLDGTSMAAPHVAGAWALVKQGRPTATVTEVLNAMTSTGYVVTDKKCTSVAKPLFYVDAAYITKWAFTIGNSSYSSPAIGADGTIYVTGTDEANFGVTTLFAINPDGTLKWSLHTSGGSSPAVGADGTIYIGGGLEAVNPDGTLKWSLGSFYKCSPALGADGTIYAVSGSFVYALNPGDGSPKWKYATGDPISSPPAIGADGTIYVGTFTNNHDHGDLYAINPDGSPKWKYVNRYSILSSPVIGADGTIYVGSEETYLHAINPDGSLKWKYHMPWWVSSSPVIGADGTIYVGSATSRDDKLHAINPDGSLKWSYGPWFTLLSSPAIGADGTIYAVSSGLHAFNPDGSLKWRHACCVNAGTSPAIGADGTIYAVGGCGGVLYNDKLFAYIGSSAGLANSPWPMFGHDPKHTGRAGSPIPSLITITLTKPGTGTGVVTSSPSGINCGSTCAAGFTQGTQVTLTATTEPGSTFTGWSGGGCSGTGTCTVTMNSAITVAATFATNPTLTLTKSGTGTGVVTSSPSGINCGSTCSASFAQGQTVTLTATTEPGSTFTGWSGGGCSGKGICTITMNNDAAVTASFAEQTCTYMLNSVAKSFTAAGGSVPVTVTGTGMTSCPAPAVSEDYDWITTTLSPWIKNKGTVKIAVVKTNTSLSRIATVTIGGQPFAVTQAGAACAITKINPTSQNFGKSVGSGTFAVEVAPSDCAWTITTSAAWIYLPAGGRTGNGTVNYTFDANTGKVARTGAIAVTLTQNKKKGTFTVKQSNK